MRYLQSFANTHHIPLEELPYEYVYERLIAFKNAFHLIQEHTTSPNTLAAQHALQKATKNYNTALAYLTERRDPRITDKAVVTAYRSYCEALKTLGIKKPQASLEKADALYTWLKAPARKTLSCSIIEDSETIKLSETPLGTLTPLQIKTFLAIARATPPDFTPKAPPLWFKILPLWQKKAFVSSLSPILAGCATEAAQEKALQAFFESRPAPTTVHQWAGITNASFHGCIHNAEKFPERVRAGTPVPFHLLEKNSLYQEAIQITEENILQIIDAWVERHFKKSDPEENISIPVMIQSIYNDAFLFSSPLKKIIKTEFILQDEGLMELIKDRAIKNIAAGFQKKPYQKNGKTIHLNLISTAHSVNAARFFSNDFKNKEKVLEAGIVALQKNENPRLRKAIESYISISKRSGYQIPVIGPFLSLASSLFSKESYTNRNLEIASLEQIIISESGGMAFGSCKSGKDRKALETMHTDSMLIFFEQKNHYPNFESETDRRLFSTIFSKIFRSEIHEAMAASNAFGSHGIKNSAAVLPEFIKKRIELDAKKEYKINHNGREPPLKRLIASHAAASLNRFRSKNPVSSFLKPFKPPIFSLMKRTLVFLLSPLLIGVTFFQSGANFSLKTLTRYELKNPLNPSAHHLLQIFAILSAFTGIPTVLKWIQDIRIQYKIEQAVGRLLKNWNIPKVSLKTLGTHEEPLSMTKKGVHSHYNLNKPSTNPQTPKNITPNADTLPKKP